MHKISSIALLLAATCFAANPLTTKFYSADAAALVHNDSLFIFAGHDEQGAQGTTTSSS